MLPTGSSAASGGAYCVGRSCLCTKVPVPLMHEVHLAADGKQLTEHLLVPCLLSLASAVLAPFWGYLGFGRCFDMKLGQQTR